MLLCVLLYLGLRIALPKYTLFQDEETDLGKIETLGQTMLASKFGTIVICHLMTGIHSEKCIIRWFHGSVNITGCTYTNLDGIVYYTPRQCHIYSLLLCRGAKINFPSTLLHPWLRYPYKKRQLAEKLKFNNMCISCIHGRDPEKWVTCQNGWSHHLQYYLQLKTKDVGGRGSQLWEVTRKSTGGYTNISPGLLHW